MIAATDVTGKPLKCVVLPFVVMLNQAATDRKQLAKLMGISENQESYITDAEAGHGLAKIGGALVPFVNHLPKDTELYGLMTTKFNE